MKFDLTIGNPPYTSGVDIDVHKSFSGISKRIVFVHPSTFLISHKRNSFKKQMKRIDMRKLETAHLFWGNALFNIQLYMPIVISTWNVEKTNETVHVIDDAYNHCEYDVDYDKVHHYGKDYPRFLDWVNKNVMPLVEKNGSVGGHGAYEVTEQFGFKMSTMRGHPPLDDGDSALRDDFYTILPQSDKVVRENFCSLGDSDTNYKRMFSFKTEEERENFLWYLKTKCVRFNLSIFKYSNALMRGEMTQIPWMDFTIRYSDADLRKLWNIDDELWTYIDGKIPDYYFDYSYQTPFTSRQ